MELRFEDVVRAASEVCAHHPLVRAAFLFGSAARESAGPTSDLDIAVAGSRIDLTSLAAQLSIVLGHEVDLVSLNHDPPIALLREIVRDGRCLYEVAPGAATAVRAGALWAIETDGPLIDALAKRYVDRLASRVRT